MRSEARRVKLATIAAPTPNAIAAGPFGSNLVSRDYVGAGVPVIRGQNLARRWVTGEYVFVTLAKAEQLRSNIAKPGDIVFTQRGTLGQVSIVPAKPFDSYVVSQSQMKLTVDQTTADSRYVYYACTAPDFVAQIHNNAVAAGVPHINLSILRDLEIPLPPMHVQYTVAETLTTLDDRIDLLRQTNATLEAIAQALFKSWFVDFDPVRAKVEGREPEGMDAATAALFPAEFEEFPAGMLPAGWRKVPFIETVNVLGGGTPKTSVTEYWNGDIPWFSVVDAPARGQVFTNWTEKSITQVGLQNSSTRMLPLWTTIISARGTVGKLAMTARPMAMNQSCYGLVPKRIGSEPLVYLAAQRLVENLRRLAHGGVFDTITRDTLTSVEATQAPPEIEAAFAALVRPIFEQIQSGVSRARTLSDIRDSLLPRLISGKLRLPEAQEQVEEALA